MTKESRGAFLERNLDTKISQNRVGTGQSMLLGEQANGLSKSLVQGVLVNLGVKIGGADHGETIVSGS